MSEIEKLNQVLAIAGEVSLLGERKVKRFLEGREKLI